MSKIYFIERNEETCDEWGECWDGWAEIVFHSENLELTKKMFSQYEQELETEEKDEYHPVWYEMKESLIPVFTPAERIIHDKEQSEILLNDMWNYKEYVENTIPDDEYYKSCNYVFRYYTGGNWVKFNFITVFKVLEFGASTLEKLWDNYKNDPNLENVKWRILKLSDDKTYYSVVKGN